VIHDVPLRLDGRETDGRRVDSVFHEPDRTLAGCGVFPHQIGLAVPVEVCGTRDMPLRRNDAETDTRLKHTIFENPNCSRTVRGVFPH